MKASHEMGITNVLAKNYLILQVTLGAWITRVGCLDLPFIDGSEQFSVL